MEQSEERWDRVGTEGVTLTRGKTSKRWIPKALALHMKFLSHVAVPGTGPFGKIRSDNEQGRSQSPPILLTVFQKPQGLLYKTVRTVVMDGMTVVFWNKYPQQFRFAITIASAPHISQTDRQLQRFYSWPHIQVCF